MGAFDLARPQGPAALVIGTVIHTIFKPRHMIDELAQALVGVVLMALLPRFSDLIHLTGPQLIQITRHPRVTRGALKL